MTRKEFELLSVSEQACVLQEHGVFVSEKVDGGKRLYLYLINYFFVELLHDFSDPNKVQGLTISRIFEDERLFHEHPSLPVKFPA